MQTADKCVGRGREGGRRWLAASLLVNWKPCRRARNLPEIPIDRGILQQGRRRRGGGRRPDAPIDDCHLLHCRRPEPVVAKNRESEITAICTQESNGGRTRGEACWEMDTGGRERERAPPGKINANDWWALPHTGWYTLQCTCQCSDMQRTHYVMIQQAEEHRLADTSRPFGLPHTKRTEPVDDGCCSSSEDDWHPIKTL